MLSMPQGFRNQVTISLSALVLFLADLRLFIYFHPSDTLA